MSNQTVVNCINSINNLSASETRILRTTSRSEICPLTTVMMVTGDVDMLSICTRPGHSTSAVRVTRHTIIIFIYAGHYLRELWWWNGDGEWRWGGDTGQLTYGGSGLTRHQAHDSKHMPAHSDTGQATHLHSSSPGPRQTTIMTLYSVKCHVDHPTAQQRRDENISV